MSFLARTMCLAARFSSNEKKSGLSFFISSSFSFFFLLHSCILFLFYSFLYYLGQFLSRDESTPLRGIRFHVPGSLLALSWGQHCTRVWITLWVTWAAGRP